jgi:hypothetical protein
MRSYDKYESKKWLRKIWLIWAAFLYILTVYIRLCYMKEKDVPYLTHAKLPLGVIEYSFLILAFVFLYFAYFYRNRWLKDQNIKISPRVVQQALKRNKPPIFLKYANDVISSVAISLCNAFLGLLYFFVSKDWQAFFVFVAISAIAIVYFRPKSEEFDRYQSKIANAPEEMHDAGRQ